MSNSHELINAINEKDEELVLHLLQNGVDVNVKDVEGFTPLMLSVQKGGNIMITEMLIRFGANINEQNDKLATALMFSVQGGNVDLVKLMLESGAQTDLQNEKGITALMNAVTRGNLQIVKLLLNHGANSTITDNKGRTAIDRAMKSKNAEIKDIFEKIKEQLNKRKSFILLAASKEGDLDRVKSLLTEENVNFQGYKNTTPLIYAIESGNFQLVEYLINNGADVNLKNIEANSPLAIATELNNLPMIKLLLDSGADINSKNVWWETPLFYAVRNKNLEIINYLILRKANVNIKNRKNKTALSLLK